MSDIKHLIIANYGNESIALLQWAIENGVASLGMVSVDTGFGAKHFASRVAQAEHYARAHQVKVSRLKAPRSFADSVIDRGQFPNQKFQWCAGFLKGLAINSYLDDIDCFGEITLLFAKRKDASRANRTLSSRIENSEYFDGRTIEYPLLEHSHQQRDALIQRAGFEVLNSRSLECEPCIHATAHEINMLQKVDIVRLERLEERTNTTMYGLPIREYIAALPKAQATGASSEAFDRGCGSAYGCGE